MKIQVLGSGCPTCRKLFEMTQYAAKQLGLKDEVRYSTDVFKIVEMGVMSSPVLAVDGKPVVVGFVPDIEKIKKLLSAAASNDEELVGCPCKDNGEGTDDCNCHDAVHESKVCHCGGNC